MGNKLYLLLVGNAAIFLAFTVVFVIALLSKKKTDKWLLGIDNLKWGFKELVKMYSNRPSFFSKKRIHEGIAFIICMHGSLFALATVVHNINDFAIWFGLHQPFIFYSVHKVQQEKKWETVPEKKEEPA